MIFPAASVTVQVTVVTPNGKEVGALFVTNATEQLSAVVGVPSATPVAVQAVLVLAVMLAGAVIVGLILSVTVTVCVAVFVFPDPSVTIHVTVVTPIGKAVGALLVTVATAQLSLVTGVPRVTPVAVQPVFVVAATFAGAVIAGKILSVTVTVCVAVLVLPAASVAVQVTVVTPIGNELGASFVIDGLAVQLSVATATPSVTPVAVHPVFVVAVTAGGAVMTGFTLSVTVTV